MTTSYRDIEFGSGVWARLLARTLRLPPALRYLVAPASTLVAWAVQYATMPDPNAAPFVMCFLAVALAGWFGGRAVGLITVVLTAVMANVAFVAPSHGWVLGPAQISATLLYLVGVTPIAILFGVVRETLLRADQVYNRLRQQTELVDLSQDAIFVWRLGGPIESWNRGAERLYGIAAVDAMGRTPRELLRTVYSTPWPQLEGELRRHEHWEGELIHRTRSGHAMTVWSRWQLLRGPDGVERVLESTRDVTERKRIEEERSRLIVQLDSERRRMETILEQSPVGIGIAEAGSDRLTYGNQRLHEILGKELQALVSAGAGDGSVRAHRFDGAPYEQLQLPMARALRGELVRGEELQLVGTANPVRTRVVSVNAAPIRSATGEVTGGLIAVQDITERTRVEIRQRRMYESGMIGVYYWNVEGVITDANDKFLQMTGFSRVDLEAGRIDRERMTPAEGRGQEEQSLEQLHRAGIEPPREKEYLRSDGRRLPVLVGSAMLDETRREAVSFVIDISDRKRAEAERERLVQDLRDADRRKDDFIAMLSHELRNPLTPVRNSLYLLRSASALDERGRNAVAVIDRQLDHLARLVDDLLDVTRMKRGRIRVQRTHVDLVDLVRRVADDYRAVFAARGLKFELALEPLPMAVDGDAERLAQVVGNLLQNSAKFTEAGGRVSLSAGRDGRGHAVIEVQDTGIGIDADTLKRLFQPFEQADRSLERTRGGLGLGLALSKGLIEMQGGTIEAFSEGLNRGARFTVTLPLAAERAAGPEVPQRARRAGPTAIAGVPSPGDRGGRRSVLVVEDNQDTAETLKEILEYSGYRVEVALDGEAGIQIARESPPDVVLCDIGLPGIDGYEVAKALRKDPSCSGTLLVAVSGYARPQDVKRAREAGFDRHIAKPPDLEQLSKMISDWGRPAAARAASPAAVLQAAKAALAPQRAAEASRRKPGSGGRILLVDDEDAFRSDLASILRDMGFEVFEARDGDECLALVQSGLVPDATLLDYRMPGLDGAQVLERLRSRGLAGQVVLITGAAAAPDLASRFQFQHYLGKPFTADDVIHIIGDLIRGRASAGQPAIPIPRN